MSQSGNKWFRRRQTQDIRKYIPSNGRIVKTSSHPIKDAIKKRVAGNNKKVNQSTLLETFIKPNITIEEDEMEPTVLATNFSKGVRKKSENCTPLTKDTMYHTTSEHMSPVEQPLKPSFLPLLSDNTEEDSIVPNYKSNKDTYGHDHELDGDCCSTTADMSGATSPSESYSTIEPDSYSSRLISNQLSPSSVLRILNCDTDEFINNL